MAILEAPKSSSRIRIEGLVPKGTYIATCIAIEDQFGVQRAKYDDPTTLETVNLTSFYFGLKNKQGEMFLIRSKPFKMSLHEKSALFQFLKSWTAEPPRPGFDTETMVSKGLTPFRIDLSAAPRHVCIKGLRPWSGVRVQ